MAGPIFIVGMPRSGSTALYNALARHPDLAFISQTSKKFPRSVWLTRLFGLLRHDRRPTEGHRIWRRFARPEDDALGREHATPVVRRYYRKLVAAHLRLHGRPRFLSKYPRNVLRLPWLDEIFPDAVFVHLLRDGRAVAQSTLEMRLRHGGASVFWGIRPPGWRRLAELEPLVSIGLQWKWTIEYARRSAQSLPEGRYIEVRYEDFCARPAETLRELGERIELEWPAEDLARASAGIESRNYKWQERFSRREVAILERVLETGSDIPPSCSP
jgi:hypothetical protein